MTPEIKQRIQQIKQGKTPKGYKKTIVGIIPSDWSLKSINHWITLKERPIQLLDDEEYQLVTIRRGYGGVDSRGYFYGKDILVKTYFMIHENDFIISKRQIAHGACGVAEKSVDNAVVSNEYDVFIKNDCTDINMFNLMMQLPRFKRLFYLMSDGVHIEKLRFKTEDWMKQYLALPPLPEQTAIAEILSTQDRLIELKEQLLAEKKRQKKYLMQQLLTGKMRLKGFKGEWKVCEFQKLFLIPSRNGLSKPSSIRGNGYKMINMGELFANDRIYNIEMERVPLTETEKSIAKVEPYDLLFARQSMVAEGAGKVSIVMETQELIVFESHIIRIRLNQSLSNPQFYYYYFMSDYSPTKNMIIIGAQAGIKASDLVKTIIPIPPLPEQTAIAEILSTADREIELIGQSIEAEKRKKKSLMQLLLTGIVRVP